MVIKMNKKKLDTKIAINIFIKLRDIKMNILTTGDNDIQIKGLISCFILCR